MTRYRATLALAALFLAAACAEEGAGGSTSPEAKGTQLTPTRPALMVGTTGVGDYTATMTGPLTVKTAGYKTYSVSVSGGTGPFYYYWNEEVCWADGTCRRYPITSGVGISSISHYIRSDMDIVELTVQVGDAATKQYSVIAGTTITGPAAFVAGGGGGNPSMCQALPSWCPWKDPVAGTNFGKAYYRSSCNGSKQYDPTCPTT